MRYKSLLFSIILFSVFAVSQSTAKPSSADANVHSEMLVSTKWLAGHLKDPNLVILHGGGGSMGGGFLDYKRGHIPGARFLDESKMMVSVGQLNSEMPSPADLQKLFSDLGISDSSHVVIYSTSWMPIAARAYLTLDYIGFKGQASLLDGGIEQWLNEDRPVTTEVPKFAPASLTIHLNENVRTLYEEVKTIVDAKPGEELAQIVDARPARRYTQGHISGATNMYWMDTLVSADDPVFQSPEKLRALYAQRGIVPGKKVITYCEVGQQASHAYFLAKYLGYDVAMYDGSYQEWDQVKKMPVVNGESKREEKK